MLVSIVKYDFLIYNLEKVTNELFIVSPILLLKLVNLRETFKERRSNYSQSYKLSYLPYQDKDKTT